MPDPTVDPKTALIGVANAQLASLKTSAQELLLNHTISIINDAIESAASAVGQMPDTDFASGGKAKALDTIRQLKIGAR